MGGKIAAKLLSNNMPDFLTDPAVVTALEKTIAAAVGVPDTMIDAVVIQQGVTDDFDTEFKITVPADGTVAITTEEAQTKLAEADVQALLNAMQAKLDAETGQ